MPGSGVSGGFSWFSSFNSFSSFSDVQVSFGNCGSFVWFSQLHCSGQLPFRRSGHEARHAHLFQLFQWRRHEADAGRANRTGGGRLEGRRGGGDGKEEAKAWSGVAVEDATRHGGRTGRRTGAWLLGGAQRAGGGVRLECSRCMRVVLHCCSMAAEIWNGVQVGVECGECRVGGGGRGESESRECECRAAPAGVWGEVGAVLGGCSGCSSKAQT